MNKQKTVMIDGMANELTSIIKSAVALAPAPYSGGVKNLMKDSLTRGWNTGGGLAKGLTGLQIGASLPGALSKEDPTGQGRSRPERVAELGGSTVGMLAGTGMGANLGNMITRKIDPTDKYLTNASHVLENQKFDPVLNSSGSIRNIKGVMMDGTTMGQLADRRLDKTIAQRAGKLQSGNIGRWAKFKIPRTGLLAIPGALSIAGGLLGTGLGEKIMGLPFKGSRSTPQQTQVAPQEVPASIT